jgi:site-specific DNA recombinase
LKRAIILTRVSTDEQKKNNSPSAQRTDGLAYAQRHGFTVLDVMNEDYTGTTIDRPVFNRLLELADGGFIDVVIMQHPDRLGRDHILQLAIALLVNRGVEVHACNRGLISDEDDENAQIQNSVDALVSGVERRNIRRRLTRGIVEKVTVKQKVPGYGGAAPYGYAWEGYRRERTLVTNQAEARIVTQIFEWYDSGISVISICERLEAIRRPRPAKIITHRMDDNRYKWITPTIYRILKNRTYIGTFIAFSRTSKQVKKRLHTVPVGVPVQAILSSNLFERVQQRLGPGRTLAQRNTKRFYLLRCRIQCKCGSSAVACHEHDYRYYRCSATIRKRDRRQPCDMKRFNGDNTDYTVWHWIEEHVLDAENLKEGIARKRASTASTRQKLEDEWVYYADKLEDNAKAATRLKQLYGEGVFKLEDTKTEKKQLDDARAKLEHEREEVAKRIAGLGLSEDDERLLMATVGAIKTKAQNLSDAGMRKVIDVCETAVKLYFKDGKPWCHIDIGLTLQGDDVPIVSHDVYNVQHNQDGPIELHSQ